MESTIFAAFASHGVLGVCVAALSWWVVSLHRELRDERGARITDVKGYTDTLIGMQKQVLTAADKLSDVQTELKEQAREVQRDRDRRRL